MKRFLTTAAMLVLMLGLSGCGYNKLQSADASISAGWSEVVNQYQRRADLIPNFVETVRAFASQGKSVLLGVTKARSKVGSIQATPEMVNDPAAFEKFTAAQGELSSALSRLLVVVENYPQLKSIPISAICRHTPKERKTASRWRASAISGQCRNTT